VVCDEFEHSPVAFAWTMLKPFKLVVSSLVDPSP
jgi:hypothetical protein